MSIQQSLSNGPTVMMTLGRFRFGILTAAYQELNRSTEWRWPSQDVFMQGQALQYVGPGGDTITLPGVIYPEWRGGTGQLDAMRAEADKGQPLTLIDGNGNLMGRWVIERIDEGQRVFAARGVARKQEFTINLRKFEESGGGGGLLSAAAGILGAVAGGAAAATGQGGAPGLFASAVGTATRIANSLSDAMGQVQAVADEIGSAASSVLTPISRCLDVAEGLKNAVQDAKAVVGSSTDAINQARGMRQVLNAATSAAANIGQASGSLKRATDALGALPQDAATALQGAQITANRAAVGIAAMQAQATAAIKEVEA